MGPRKRKSAPALVKSDKSIDYQAECSLSVEEEEKDERIEKSSPAADEKRRQNAASDGDTVSANEGEDEGNRDDDEDINPTPAKMAKTVSDAGETVHCEAVEAEPTKLVKEDNIQEKNVSNDSNAGDVSTLGSSVNNGERNSTASLSSALVNQKVSLVDTGRPEGEKVNHQGGQANTNSQLSNSSCSDHSPASKEVARNSHSETTLDNNNNSTHFPKASENEANPHAPTNVPGTSPVASPSVAPRENVHQHQAQAVFEEKGQVSTLYVGRVIGKGGEMIRDLQARSGCRIDVDQNVPDGHPRIITYRGTRATIDFAKQLVQILCSERGKEAELPLGQAVRKQILVPSTVIGKIIGRGGEMIRELQSKSQAKIQVDHTGSGGYGGVADVSQRQVTVTGTEQSVVKAEEMILFLCANPAMDAMQAIGMLIRDKNQNGGVWGSGPPYQNLPNQGQGMPGASDVSNGMGGGNMSSGGMGSTGMGGYGPQTNMGYGGYGGHSQHGGGYGGQYGPAGGSSGLSAPGMIETELYPCPKMYMGRVIGQKGVTINDLQKRSGCDIQINQNVPVGQDCEISIKGSRQGIDMAKQMLQEIIEMGPNHPYAGGHGQFGSGNQFGRHQSFQHQTYQQGSFAPQGYQPQSYPVQYGLPQPFSGQAMYQPQPSYQPQHAQSYAGQLGAPSSFGPPHPPAQASPWRTATAADGQIYYYNEKTGETQWDKPPGMA